MTKNHLGRGSTQVLLCLFLMGCSHSPAQPDTGESASSVTLLNTQICDAFGHEVECLTLSVISEGLPARELMIRRYARSGSVGALVLTRGGTGNDWYTGYGPEAEATIESAYADGLEIYEYRWSGAMGWAESAEGARGYDRAVGAYSTVLRWLADNVMDNPEFILAQGNSGGSFQIAYGLAIHGLEDILDVAILSGGPPVADLRRGIFGDLDDPLRWPDGLLGFGLTDYIMGWLDNGDYCLNRWVPPEMEAAVFAALDSVSLVSLTAPRDYDYPTRVHFIQTDDETNADDQAAHYFDILTGDKEWHYFGEITDHAVPGTPEGGGMIRKLIKEELGIPTSASIPTSADPLLRTSPNPFTAETVISFTLGLRSGIRLAIFSAAGKRVRKLLGGELPVGAHRIAWDGRDDRGRELASGVYLIRIELDGREEPARRVILLR